MWVEEVDVRREPGYSMMAGLRHAFDREMQERYPNCGLYFGPETLPDGLYRPDGAFFILWDNGEVIGCAGLRKLPAKHAKSFGLDESEAQRSAEGRSMFIVPERRGGIAAAILMRALAESAIEHGYETVYGDTGPNQPESDRVLHSFGLLRGLEDIETKDIPVYDPDDPLATIAVRVDLGPSLRERARKFRGA